MIGAGWSPGGCPCISTDRIELFDPYEILSNRWDEDETRTTNDTNTEEDDDDDADHQQQLLSGPYRRRSYPHFSSSSFLFFGTTYGPFLSLDLLPPSPPTLPPVVVSPPYFL